MSEIQELRSAIVGRLRQVVALLDGLDAEGLNAPPVIEGANSPYVLAAHTLGNARAWVLGIAFGQDVSRDRPGEFASSGDTADALRDALAAFERDFEHAAASFDSANLDRRFVPRQDLWGPNPAREITVRRAFLNVLEHASLHLGHLELTRDIMLKK